MAEIEVGELGVCICTLEKAGRLSRVSMALWVTERILSSLRYSRPARRVSELWSRRRVSRRARWAIFYTFCIEVELLLCGCF